MDSLNTPLKKIIEFDTNKRIDLTVEEARQREMKLVLGLIEELYIEKRNIFTMNAEMRIKEIVGSYRDAEKSSKIDEWFKEEYAPKVI